MALPGSPTQQWIFAVVVVAGGAMVAVQSKNADVIEPIVTIEQTVEKIAMPPVAEVVRIDGALATIAGTGTPGEEIIVMDGALEVARTTVEADGTFAMVFDYAVPATGSKLDLVEINKEGQKTTAAKSIAVLPREGADPALASLEGDVIKIEVGEDKPLTFSGVVYGEGPEATLSGVAAANSNVEITLDGEKVGQLKTGDDGQWSLMVSEMTEGKHFLGLADDNGQSFEVEIDRGNTTLIAEKNISSGDTLWRIAETQLGDGRRFIDIYNLNAASIKNPDLIYPNQVIILPNS